MNSGTGISDRHLRKTLDLADVPAREMQRVRIVVSDRWAVSVAGQLLVSCLVNLLCRQVGLVGYIEIVARSSETLIELPSGKTASGFPACLEELAHWAVEDAVAIVTSAADSPIDHTICVGDAAVLSDDALLAVGVGWRAWVGVPSRAPAVASFEDTNPLGPFLAAAITAAEIFKKCRGIKRGRFLSAAGLSLWSGQSGPDWSDLHDGPQIASLALPAFHLIGAGAVGNGLAYILANASLSEGYVALIDDDTYDETSLNRCFLAGWEDIDDPKVQAVSDALKVAGFQTFPFKGTLIEYLKSGKIGLADRLKRQADNLSFELVVSCVDRGASRQDIQSLDPEILIGGSTLGLAARSDFYPQRSGAACLSCRNPAERDGEKIQRFKEQLRSMSRDQRACFLIEQGVDPLAVEEYLAREQCGTLGERAVNDLATRTPPAFSVGFVSLGAALLLASLLFRLTLFRETAVDRGDMSALNFLNGGFGDAFIGPDEACEWGCQERRAG